MIAKPRLSPPLPAPLIVRIRWLRAAQIWLREHVEAPSPGPTFCFERLDGSQGPQNGTRGPNERAPNLRKLLKLRSVRAVQKLHCNGFVERIPSILALLLVASVGACTSQASDSGPGQDVLEGKLSNNGLVLNHEHLDQLSTEALAFRAGDEILLNEEAFAPLLAEVGGDELLAYLATCALSEDQSMVVASTGQQFSGNLGLAPQWIGEVCDASCQRWISSCLLAHANAFDTAVAISPRGANPGLRWDDAIAREFGHLEAAYYGNVFVPENERIMSACSGEALLGGKTSGSDYDGDLQSDDAAFMSGRICGVGSCGFTFTGYCQDPALQDFKDLEDVGLTPVCTEFRESFYGQCSTESGASMNPAADRFAEVITVYLPE